MQKGLKGRGWHKDQSKVPWQEHQCMSLKEMRLERICERRKVIIIEKPIVFDAWMPREWGEF